MKNKSKKVILSIITLVLVVVALGTTTFAWFTLSGTSTVSDITGTVQAGEGLEIALEADGLKTAYKTNLGESDWADILGQINTGGNNFKFGAVSSEDGKNFYSVGVQSTVGGNTILEKIAAPAVNSAESYLEFTIHFKSNSGGTIDWTSYGFVDDTTTTREFTPDKAFVQAAIDGTTTKIDPIQVATSNAARIAIVKDDDNVVIVENGENATYTNTYGQSTGVLHGQYSYLTEKGNTIDWGGVTEPSLVAIYNADTDTTNGTTVASLAQVDGAGDFYGQVTVRVWLEGWDADAYDSIFQLGLNFNLGFDKVQLP